VLHLTAKAGDLCDHGGGIADGRRQLLSPALDEVEASFQQIHPRSSVVVGDRDKNGVECLARRRIEAELGHRRPPLSAVHRRACLQCTQQWNTSDLGNRRRLCAQQLINLLDVHRTKRQPEDQGQHLEERVGSLAFPE
jgi:hypothetical protein